MLTKIKHLKIMTLQKKKTQQNLLSMEKACIEVYVQSYAMILMAFLLHDSQLA